MKKFLDSSGREWSLNVTIGDAKRIKSNLSVDLLDHRQITELAGDPYKLADVIYSLCGSQAKAAGVTDEQFGEGLAGDAIDDATTALLEAITDFFPKRQRPALISLLAKIKEANTKGAELAEAKLNSPQMHTAIQTALDNASNQIDTILGELSGKPLA